MKCADAKRSRVCIPLESMTIAIPKTLILIAGHLMEYLERNLALEKGIIQAVIRSQNLTARLVTKIPVTPHQLPLEIHKSAVRALITPFQEHHPAWSRDQRLGGTRSSSNDRLDQATNVVDLHDLIINVINISDKQSISSDTLGVCSSEW